MDIQSPCVRNCCLDGNDICLGCFRSIDEILRWSSSTNVEKNQIIHDANKRKLEREQKTPL